MTPSALHCTIAGSLLALTAALPAQTPCASPGAQIIAWWDGAPNAANRAIDLVGTTDADLRGGAALGAMPGFDTAAFVFDGENDHLASVREMDGLDGNDWSFEGWIRPTRLGTFQGIVSKLDPVTERAGDFALLVTPDGRLQFRYRRNSDGGTSERILHTAPIFAVGTPRHVGVSVFNGSSVELFVDGQRASFSNTNQSFGALPSGGFDRSTFVGCVLPGAQHFEGEMDELTFYDRRLFVDEIAEVAGAGNALKCKQAAPLPAGAVSWYDGETCREHALDRVGLEAAPLTPRVGANVTVDNGIVGNGFDLGSGGGLNTQRPPLRTTGPFTVEMWVFRRRNNVEEVLFSELNQVGRVAGEFALRFADGSIRLVRATGIGNQADGVSSRLNIPLDRWSHVAAVFAGPGDLRLFVNGERDDRAVGGTTIGAGDNQDGGFGVGVGGLAALRARIDECTLYRAAVSDAEIEAIYRAGRFGKRSQADRALDCRSGTIEDLRLDVTLSQGQVLAPPSLQLVAGDVLLVEMTSPTGTFDLNPYGILVQAYGAATPPLGSFPDLAVDLGGSAFIAGGLTPSPFGLPLLNPAGAQVALVIPSAIAGLRVRIQGFALNNLAANGTFAATDPIDLQVRAAAGGPGT